MYLNNLLYKILKMSKQPVKAKTSVAASREFNPKEYEHLGIPLEDVKLIKEAFDLFDADKSGKIDTTELKEALETIKLPSESATLQNIMESLDSDKSGNVDFNEFINLLSAKAAVGDTREDLKKVFDLFTGGKTNKITIETLRGIATELSDLNLTENEMQEMISRADNNKDKAVDFEEFYQIMVKKLN